MSTILVTGGAGFIGSHMARYLWEQGHCVVVLDDLSGGTVENLGEPMSCNFTRGDILDAPSIEKLFVRWNFEYVIHMAAYAAEGLSHFIKRFNYQNNLVGSVNLINAAVNHGVKRFLFTSSMAVYGSNQVPFAESMTPAPEDSYGISKYAVEQELKVTRELFGMEYVIFRPHNVIGERQNIDDRYRNVAGIFMSQILRHEPMSIFGDGEQRRAFSYVGDMVPIMAEALFLDHCADKTFNIGGESAYSINELATMIADIFGVDRNVVHLPPRYEVRNAFSDHSELCRVFGSRELTPVPEALRKMAQWAQGRALSQHRKRISEISPDGLEISKNLPESWRE